MADDIQIEIEPEADTNVELAVDPAKDIETKPDGEDPIAELKKQHEELQAQFEREKTQRSALEQRARDAEAARMASEQARQSAISQASDAHLSSIEQGLSSAQEAFKSAQVAYRAAMEAGNWDASADAQARLALSAAEIKQHELAKANLEADRAQPRQTQVPLTPEIVVSRMTPASRAWVQAHMEYMATPEKQGQLTAAHQWALAQGNVVDTPAYFTAVEDALGLSKPANDKPRESNGQFKKRESAPVAPVSSSGGGTSGGSPIVKLTPGEVKSSEDGTICWKPSDLVTGRIKDKSQIGKPIGRQEFARRKLAMQKEGRYGSQYYEN